MQTWAVLNQKGGSGKTTTAVNVAAALGERGTRVLVVDLDPQGSASAWLGAHEDGRGLLDVFTGAATLASLVRETAFPRVAVIPASQWLVGVDRAVAGEPGAETILRKALGKLPPKWDLVLLDCPPSLGLLSVSALVAAASVLVPVEASTLGLAGLTGLFQTVDMVKDRLNPALDVGAIVACRVDTRTNLSRDVLAELARRFPALTLKTAIRESVRLKEAWSFSQPVTVYAPTSSGAEDYRAVAGELLTRLRRSA